MMRLRGLLILCLVNALSAMAGTPGQFPAANKVDPAEVAYRQALELAAADDKQRSSQRYVELMLKAAEAGHAKARTNIGYAYAAGEGVPRDPKEAVRWFRMAAAQGDPVAMDDLGYAYLNGDGVAKSPAEAIRWYAQAAEKGYGPSQVTLSDIYGGDTKEADLPLAIAWRRIALLSEDHMKEAPALLALEKKADKAQLREAKAAFAAIQRRMPKPQARDGMTK